MIFLNLIRCVGMWDPADENLPKRLDATLLQRMLDDNGETLGQVYSRQPDKVRELIETIQTAKMLQLLRQEEKP